MKTCYTSLCFDLSVVIFFACGLVTHCLALVCFLEIFGWFGNHGFPLPLTLVLCKDHCLRVDNSWFGTGLLSLLYGSPKYLGGLAMTCLAFLSN
jgi:hypothetical protein